MSRRYFAALLLLGSSVVAPLGAQGPRGHLLLLGGGGAPAGYWAKFVELAGGPDAPIVVVPTASERPEAGPEIVAELTSGLGCKSVRHLELKSAAEAARPEIVAALAGARGIFFTGGDQSRITAALLGSPALEAVRRVYEEGGVVGGTSAGLACMSRQMLTGDGDMSRLTGANIVVVPGLGLWPTGILDQHFIARQRLNRLLAVVLEHPQEVGIGVDERTAVWLPPGSTFEVLGESVVVVLDARQARAHRAPGPKGELLGSEGVMLRVLLPGDHFDLRMTQR